MDNSLKEWSAPSVEALTQADGVDEASQVAYRNGLMSSLKSSG